MNLVEHAEILALLEQIEPIAGELTSNEREMYAHLAQKYETPTQGAFDDKVCLEVLIRNVGIRKGFDMKPAEANRVIDLPRK
ncbi:MAG: hypothetical protein ACR2O4_08500 [Hyphomicrobiaceae bacterium]